MQNTHIFTFQGHKVDLEAGAASFQYVLDKNREKTQFTEKITFPSVVKNTIPEPLLKAILDTLLLTLGISYWKLYCPSTIVLSSLKISKEQANFWNTVYTKGLGEFFYKNKIDFRGLVQFPYEETAKPEPTAFPREDRSLLPIGGGKDSIVAAELLKTHKKPFTAFTVNSSTVQEETIKLLKTDDIIIKRILDPKLLELNKEKDTYNGHVPISVVYAGLGVFAAILYNYRYIVLSNEKSANYGNIEYLGEMINHQWSKSQEFEKLFQDYVKTYITPDITYFSLLRPLHEITIAKLFSKYKQYFSVFSSCNRNFTLANTTGEKIWCGKCPKCAFVFAMLAAFLSKKELIAIFGQNLFADKALLALYKELLGVSNFKPFECVGTPEETKVAFYLASKRGEFSADPVIQFFMKDVLPTFSPEKTEKEVFATLPSDNMPSAFADIIKNL